LDDEFVTKFIKSKGALADADTFTFTCKDNKGEIILGYSSINSNRISINVNCTCEGDIEPIAFSAKYLKAILIANKGSNKSSLKISSKGLAHLSFEDGDYVSNYYLVEIK
jgi:ribosome-interacting GTPase 1